MAAKKKKSGRNGRLALGDPNRLGWRVDELAAAAGIPRSSLYKLIDAGRLEAIRYSESALMIPRAAWERFCAENSTCGSGEAS